MHRQELAKLTKELQTAIDADNEAHCQNIIEDVKKLHEEYGYEMVDEDECEDGQIEKV